MTENTNPDDNFIELEEMLAPDFVGKIEDERFYDTDTRMLDVRVPMFAVQHLGHLVQELYVAGERAGDIASAIFGNDTEQLAAFQQKRNALHNAMHIIDDFLSPKFLEMEEADAVAQAAANAAAADDIESVASAIVNATDLDAELAKILDAPTGAAELISINGKDVELPRVSDLDDSPFPAPVTDPAEAEPLKTATDGFLEWLKSERASGNAQYDNEGDETPKI